MRNIQGVNKGRLIKALCEEFGEDSDEFEIYISPKTTLVIYASIKLERRDRI